MLNKEFIIRKIKLIQEDLARLEQFGNFKFDEEGLESMEYAATERLLEKIVTRAIDINKHIVANFGNGNESIKTYEETFFALAKLGVYNQTFAKTIAPSAGLRNILVHEYDNIQMDTLYSSKDEALIQYAQYCNYILEFIKNLL